jgi:hypothetical protein
LQFSCLGELAPCGGTAWAPFIPFGDISAKAGFVDLIEDPFITNVADNKIDTGRNFEWLRTPISVSWPHREMAFNRLTIIDRDLPLKISSRGS